MYCFYNFLSVGLTTLWICLGWAGQAAADPAEIQGAVGLAGHMKYRFNYLRFPEDSLYRQALGSSSLDQYLETRLRLSAETGQWDYKADYQFVAIRADTLRLAEDWPGSSAPVDRVISDDLRWWNLTWRSDGRDRTVFVHRLDRLSVAYTTERTAWRFGRQAISWGNGMLFTPMDVFNPFDPAAVDKEYKTGDDMLYGQYLASDGTDLQGVIVVRRDPDSGEVTANQSSAAVKYHGFLGVGEVDLLAAQHYGDRLFGLGGNIDLGGAVLRGDLTWTRTDTDEIISAVASLSYSWTWGGRNVSGLLEYYHSGFGQAGSDYSPAALAGNPDLLARLRRGELYTLGRNYLGASATAELTPLLLLVPSLFLNLDDPSALAQLVLQYGLAQDWDLLCALNVPIGPGGSEYGGIPTPVEGYYLSTDPGLFAQLAWYF
jgi:hypothetical protein